jgi:hypothetical protein
MSAGSFVISKYQSTELPGEIFPIRVQPETLALNIGGANAAPEGGVTVDLFANVSGGKRAYGVKPRKVSLRWEDGDTPDGYAPNSSFTLPILSATTYAAISVGDRGDYLGSEVVVVGKLAETKR